MDTVLIGVDGRSPVEALRVGLSYRQRVRLLVPFESTLRQLLFLKVCPDGSIVCGSGIKSGSYRFIARRRASSEPLPDKVRAEVGEGHVPPGFHLTFHTTGVINCTLGARTYRAALTGTKPHQLCLFRFQHPRALRQVTWEAPDLTLPIAIDPSRALDGQLTLIDSDAPVVLGNRGPQIAVILDLLGGEGRDQLSVQLSLYHRLAPSPDATEMTWVSQDAVQHGFDG